MSVAVATHQPPVAAPAPAAPVAEVSAQAVADAPQRLSTSLAAVPMVQRKCAACEAEDEHTMVHPKLEVGPVDDPFEREADDIADRVMAMRHPGPATGAGPVVQRACAACSSSDDLVRRRADPQKQATEDDEEKVRMRANTAGGESIGASAFQLTSGGASLPSSTRQFFEARMGRDLSGVRLHSGAAADALNASISARAFTYKNHIWLSRHESAGPTPTMAHELAHVLQQTAPGPLGAGSAVLAKRDEDDSLRRKPVVKVFGYAPYWDAVDFAGSGALGKKNSGEFVHKNFLPAIQQVDPSVFTEVSIPLSKTRARGKQAKRGRADLYRGTDVGGNFRAIGVNFRRANDPRDLSFSAGQSNNSSYRHSTMARPRLYGKAKELIGLTEAPVKIDLADLKPASQLKKGHKQLDGYKTGINETRRLSNKYVEGQHVGEDPSTWAWPDINYGWINAKTPDPQDVSALAGEKKLAIYDFGGFKDDDGTFRIGTLVHTPPTEVKGKLKAGKDGNGVYYYWWEPTTAPLTGPPSKSLTQLFPVSSAMIDSLKYNKPVDIPALPAATPGAATVSPKRSGNVKPIKNSFDKEREKKWNKAHKGLKKRFKEPDSDAVVTNYYMAEIDSNLPSDKRKGIASKINATPAGKHLKKYRDLRLMTAPFAPIMSRGRRLLGGTFIKISKAYEKIKAKFNRNATPKNKLKGGGILGALIKVALKVLLLIGRQVVAGTMMALNTRLSKCLDSFLDDFFSKGTLGEVKNRFEEFEQSTVGPVKDFINGGLNSLSESLFGPYGKKVDEARQQLETLTKRAGPILTAYKVVKWGIQALACASPPVVGCLWGLARSAIEWAAGKIIQTCWFMKKITPKILKIDIVKNFIGNTSNELSKAILVNGGGLFPEPVKGFLEGCGTEAPTVAMPPNETICEEGGGLGNSPEPSPEAQAFWERWEDLPEPKQQALERLMKFARVKQDTQVDWEAMETLLDWAEETGASKMSELAAQARTDGAETSLPEAVESVRKAAETGEKWKFKKPKEGGKGKGKGKGVSGEKTGKLPGEDETKKDQGKGGPPSQPESDKEEKKDSNANTFAVVRADGKEWKVGDYGRDDPMNPVLVEFIEMKPDGTVVNRFKGTIYVLKIETGTAGKFWVTYEDQ